MPKASNQWPSGLLKPVARSFYLTLRVLPAKIRPPIGLAYLLARTSDTIADTELVAVEQRLQSLGAFREAIARGGSKPDFGQLARHQAREAERLLLEHCGETLEALGNLAAPDQNLVRQVLDIIISGQDLDLQRFGRASADHIIALATEAELDDYTYRVAGCVGEFWTKMCRLRLFAKARLDDSFLLTNGVRFGQGLQLVNVLRDLPVDLRQGRCYLPNDQLHGAGLSPHDLLEPANESRFRPLYHRHLDRAEAHLRAGWEYTLALPRRSARVRLACAWPILIGLDTLALLRTANVLQPEARIKVDRQRVKKNIRRSILLYPWPRAWAQLVPRPQEQGNAE